MKTVIEMAREADFCVSDEGEISTNNSYGILQGELDKFAELVRADEREACAKLCEEAAQTHERYTYDAYDGRYDWKADSARDCADAIRERSANAGARGHT